MADFKLTKELLDKRICDVKEGLDSTETYREFIHKQAQRNFLVCLHQQQMKC